ncbi:MAG TPA: hypothetical protein VNX65_05020 [Patescibacteria group bacterium]|jgi:hypothetical protein|nr:hypothetical protein [Patescibacteria group bacterium]
MPFKSNAGTAPHCNGIVCSVSSIFETTDSKIKAFHFKMNAAHYHHKKMSAVIDKAKADFIPSKKDEEILLPDELYFHMDGCLYELYAAFDMILQYLAIKHSLDIADRKIGWNDQFQKVLHNSSLSDFDSIEASTKQRWYYDLRAARIFIAHYDAPVSLVAFDDKRVIAVGFGIPGMRQNGDMLYILSECANGLNLLLEEIK